MLSLSKHGAGFFNRLLAVIFQGTDGTVKTSDSQAYVTYPVYADYQHRKLD